MGHQVENEDGSTRDGGGGAARGPEVSGLHGMRVALLEARMAGELASLVRRHGGEPYCVPAVREERREVGPEVSALVDSLAREPNPVVVFTTGVGAAALLAAGESLGRGDQLYRELCRALIVARGPKPVGVLARAGIRVAVRVREPYTGEELREALEPLELWGRYVALLHYGERSDEIAEVLRRAGARLQELLLYEWRLPEDTEALCRLVREMVAGEVGAAAFTSRVQVRHLFGVAAALGMQQELQTALHRHVVVAAVGPTCARALVELGAPPQVVPDSPKMGPMLRGLAEYIDLHPRA